MTPKSSNKLLTKIKFIAGSDSLKNRALMGSIIVAGTYIFSQILRLISNLILTRILAPDAFGIMVLTMVFLQGFQLFSDIGIGPSIIHNKRSTDNKFLNTAWTLQVIRGVLVFSLTAAAAIPAAHFYNQPMLAQLILAIAFAALIDGITPTSRHTASRDLSYLRLSSIEITSQIVTLGVTVAAAFYFKNAWALVIGALFGIGLKSLGIYWFVPGIKNRFTFEIAAAKEIFHFGKWIFLNTLLTFITRQGDRIMLGTMITSAQLGVYSVAIFMIEAAEGFASHLITKIVYPVFSQLAKTDYNNLSQSLYRVRLRIEWLILPAASVVLILGDRIVKFLYDDRYVDAGWMLQILAIGLCFGPLGNVGNQLLLAMGHARYTTVVQGARAILLLVSIPVMYSWQGLSGVIFAISINFALSYPITLIMLHQMNLIIWKKEIRIVLPITCGLMIGYSIDVLLNLFFS
jgi:O-antigen/teichoic acid export membrane protein